MNKCAFPIAYPVIHGCNHSKGQEILDQDCNYTKETSFGTELILEPNKERDSRTKGEKTSADREIVQEPLIQAVRVPELHAAHNETSSAIGRESHKKTNPLSRVAPTLNRNWLDFPFFTHQKTYRYLSKGKSKVMFIMRGAPGSGKSSIVKVLRSSFPDAVICSADDYFIDEDGVYNFDFSKLPAAHGSCQYKAKSACENEMPVVIIDNTNVKRWEMKAYLDAAKQYGYVTVFVEPKTDWKFNPEELARRNSHGVPLDILKQRVEAFEHIIPLYYSWFLSHKKSNDLSAFASRIFNDCVDKFPAFQKDLVRELQLTSEGLTADTLKEVLQGYFSLKGKSSCLLHCTSRFCGNGKASGGKRYDSRTEVQAACGQVFSLTLTGLVMTSRTCGFRVTLDDSCLTLFERPEESDWNDERPSHVHSSSSKHTRKADAELSGLTFSSGNKKLSKKALNKQKRLLAKEKQLNNLKEAFPDDVEDDKPTSSLTEQNNSKTVLEENSPSSFCDDDEEDGGDVSDEVSEDSSKSQDKAIFCSLNDLFPLLKNSGFARSAHITVKTAREVASVETNFDVLHACDIEKNKMFDPSDFVTVPRGKAFYLEKGMCCVYFDEPIKVDTIFSGFY